MKSKRFDLIILVFFFFFPCLLNKAAAAAEWREVSSRHVIVYCDRETMSFARTVSKTAEEYFHRISSDLGIPVKDRLPSEAKVSIYIYKDQDEYIIASKQGEWSSGVALGGQKIIRTYPQAAGFFDTLLPHELTHIIFHHYIGGSAELPRWFSEGVAMYQEKAKRFGAHQDVKKAIEDGRFLNLRQLTSFRLLPTTPAEDVLLFYAESASVVSFLIEDMGEIRFQRFCRNLRESRSFEKTLVSTYRKFKDIEDINQEWIKYIKRQ
jgi:hypothetical protein